MHPTKVVKYDLASKISFKDFLQKHYNHSIAYNTQLSYSVQEYLGVRNYALDR